MKENGGMISSMAKGLKPGQIQVGTKESMSMGGSMALDHTNGVMAASTMVTGEKIRSVA